ncbi:hypothetical protein LSAT2_021846 [Lamellibrachia satsuma]|nr:hypothetical protein LSAT2_021846 [Lamellibrachia satsuma]
MADFDATQAIDLSDCDDETDDEVADEDKKPVAHLKVLSHKGFPETLFPLYDGNNVVGRQEGPCNVLIPLKALSKQHACIEVRAEQHFLVDKGSRNKTRRGKMFLLPEAKYELQPGDQLMFADICCVYLREGAGNTSKVRNEAVNKAEDSGSETGSESMLLPEEEVVKAVVDETFNYEEASDPSSDLLQPTQAFPADGNGLHQLSISTSVPDSDPETDPAEPAERAPEAGEPAMVAETPAIERTKGKKITMALTETLTYYEEEEDDDEEERERMACEPTQAYDSGGETDEGEGFDDNRRSAIFEAATQVCVDCEAETEAMTDPGDGFIENHRPTIFEAETQVCVDFVAETLVADTDTADNNMVDNDGTPKKVPKDEKEMSQLIFASGDLPVEDKSTNSDLDSSCDSPVFPSSLGRTEEGDGAGSSPTLNLYVGESPTLHKKIEDSEFTRPFPVVNKIPTGSEVKSRTSGQRRQQDGSPMQLPSTATSDPAVCSAQAGVADSGSVVESPEGSTGFEPKMHSTQIGGKSCHDDSFPSLHLDMSQQDACLPSNEGSLSNNTDNICTQAYGRGGNVTKQGLDEGVITDETPAYGDKEGFTNYPNKGGHIAATFGDVCTQAYGGEETAPNEPNEGRHIAANSDDVCTQAYGGEEEAPNNPNEGRHIAAKSDDVCTQAYGSEEVAANEPHEEGRRAYGGEEEAANNPNKRGRIAAKSDDVCTQAYGGEEVAANNPNKRGCIAANSDDVCTQAYGGEEGAANNPNKRGHISANSDDICTQTYGGEETAVLRSSPRRRQGRKRAVLTAEVPPTSSGSDQSQVVESSQPLEDEDDDVLMPLGCW